MYNHQKGLTKKHGGDEDYSGNHNNCIVNASIKICFSFLAFYCLAHAPVLIETTTGQEKTPGLVCLGNLSQAGGHQMILVNRSRDLDTATTQMRLETPGVFQDPTTTLHLTRTVVNNPFTKFSEANFGSYINIWDFFGSNISVIFL